MKSRGRSWPRNSNEAWRSHTYYVSFWNGNDIEVGDVDSSTPTRTKRPCTSSCDERQHRRSDDSVHPPTRRTRRHLIASQRTSATTERRWRRRPASRRLTFGAAAERRSPAPPRILCCAIRLFIRRRLFHEEDLASQYGMDSSPHSVDSGVARIRRERAANRRRQGRRRPLHRRAARGPSGFPEAPAGSAPGDLYGVARRRSQSLLMAEIQRPPLFGCLDSSPIAFRALTPRVAGNSPGSGPNICNDGQTLSVPREAGGRRRHTCDLSGLATTRHFFGGGGSNPNAGGVRRDRSGGFGVWRYGSGLLIMCSTGPGEAGDVARTPPTRSSRRTTVTLCRQGWSAGRCPSGHRYRPRGNLKPDG